MPKDNVQRAIDKGTGNLEGVEYIELRYEGYGIGGAALMVDCLTATKPVPLPMYAMHSLKTAELGYRRLRSVQLCASRLFGV